MSHILRCQASVVLGHIKFEVGVTGTLNVTAHWDLLSHGTRDMPLSSSQLVNVTLVYIHVCPPVMCVALHSHRQASVAGSGDCLRCAEWWRRRQGVHL